MLRCTDTRGLDYRFVWPEESTLVHVPVYGVVPAADRGCVCGHGDVQPDADCVGVAWDVPFRGTLYATLCRLCWNMTLKHCCR